MTSALTRNPQAYLMAKYTSIHSPSNRVMSQTPSHPEARDFRQETTNRIIQMLEDGVAPWQKPWDAATIQMPVNYVTGKPYRGGNTLQLLMTAMEKGYEDPRWMTYKQAAEKGAQVRRGQKGTQIEFWDFQRPVGKDEDIPADAPNSTDNADADPKRPRVIHRVYTVFNGNQIDGLSPFPIPKRQTVDVIEAGERILTHSGAVIHHDQADRAFYRRSDDEIHLPRRDHFKDPAAYYGTALHELAHWSGHPSRLNRATLNEDYQFGNLNYAKEELRAELTSLFLAAERGIPYDPAQHAAYLGSWIKALQDDKHEIFRAAHDASAATDYLLALERGHDRAEDGHGYRIREAKASYRSR